MSHTVVVLVIETDPAEISPARWDWSAVLDSPNPVTVLGSVAVADDPTDADMVLAHDLTRDYLTSLAPTSVTWPCLECDTPVTFTPDDPLDPDAPFCDACVAEMGW